MPYANVDDRYMQRFPHRTPQTITPAILAFCATLSPDPPQLIACREEAGCTEGNCYPNVWSTVDRRGGAIEFGWCVTVFPNAFYEAEHHAVWNDGSQLIEVTPGAVYGKGSRLQQLFVPDSTRTQQPGAIIAIPSVRQQISTLNSVGMLLNWTAQFDQWRAQNIIPGVVQNYTAAQITVQAQLQQQGVDLRRAATLELANNTWPDSFCVCGSKAKFRDCCRRFFS